jgi:hypothetical protein
MAKVYLRRIAALGAYVLVCLSAADCQGDSLHDLVLPPKVPASVPDPSCAAPPLAGLPDMCAPRVAARREAWRADSIRRDDSARRSDSIETVRLRIQIQGVRDQGKLDDWVREQKRQEAIDDERERQRIRDEQYKNR